MTEQINVVVTTTFGTDEWDVPLPPDRPVDRIIPKLLEAINERSRDDEGNPLNHRLLWVEEGRNLTPSETLGQAGVQDGHTLTLVHEARAGGFEH